MKTNMVKVARKPSKKGNIKFEIRYVPQTASVKKKTR